MYLITYNRNAMLDTDITHLRKLLCRPYTADRIMRTAQQEQHNMIINDLFLKIIKIDVIFSIIPKYQIIAHKLPVIVTDHF